MSRPARPLPFPPVEADAIRRAVRAGDDPACPGCAVALDRRRVPPRPDVAYVRRRVWLLCPSCGRSLVVDEEER